MNKKNMLLVVCVCVCVCAFVGFGVCAQAAVDAAAEADPEAWKKYIIFDNVTLDVPAQYPTVQDALAYLADKTILNHAIVTIQVADGVYNNYERIIVSHPNGARINIMGNTTNPTNCTINFSLSGLMVSNGNTLGLIDGFTFVGIGDGAGIFAQNNATITCGPNMIVKEFMRGVFATVNSYIMAINITSINNSKNGIASYYSSFINADGATSSDNGTNSVYAPGGIISFINGRSEYNGLNGIHALMGGNVYADNAVIRFNNTGIRAGRSGFVRAVNAVVVNNIDFCPAPNTCSNTCGFIEY